MINAAAMGEAAYQNDPVTNIDAAAARAFSDPSRAEIGWPLAMHLPQLDRSGCTPTVDQEQSRAIRKPPRTSSTTKQSAALIA